MLVAGWRENPYHPLPNGSRRSELATPWIGRVSLMPIYRLANPRHEFFAERC
jgi:hypothetical protein